MHNGKITAVLGAALLICTYITDMVYSDSLYIDRINERIKYAELGADPNSTYSGFTVEQLGEGYEKPEKLLGKTIIDFPVVGQFPELPTGCEITCAAALLQYLDFNADKNYLSDNYMRKNDNFYKNDKGELFGPDPSIYFVGDPKREDGYGCYAPVIVEAVNLYLDDMGAADTHRAVLLEALNSADIEKLLDEGVPLIVWASGDMEHFRYNDQSVWTATGSRRQITWLGNSHTLVLIGYDPNAYYFMDCGKNNAVVTFSKKSFLERWQENGSQTCAIKLLNE